MQSKVIILHGRADYAAQVRSEMKLKRRYKKCLKQSKFPVSLKPRESLPSYKLI